MPMSAPIVAWVLEVAQPYRLDRKLKMADEMTAHMRPNMRLPPRPSQ